MNTDFKKLSEQIFVILDGEYHGAQGWNNSGKSEPNPRKATRFTVQKPKILVRIDPATNSIDAQVEESVIHQDKNVIEQIKNIAEETRVDFNYGIIGRQIRPKTESLNEKEKPFFKVSPTVPWTPTLRSRSATRPRRMIRRAEGVRVASSIIDGQEVFHVVVIGNRAPGDTSNKPVINTIGTYDSKEDALRKARLYAVSNAMPMLGESIISMSVLAEDNYDDYDYEDDTTPDIRSGDYVRDTQDTTGEVFRMVGDPQDRRVQILDRDGSGWSIAPHRLVAVPAGDPGIKKYFGENTISEGFGHMLGSSKTSYQPLDNVKIIVRHKAPVAEEVRGSRSRNIKEIFIKRGDERFKMKENNLHAARAMARHVHGGGEVYDSIGQAISEMASEYRSLNNFVRYVNRSGMVNETNQEYVQLAQKRVQNIRETFRKLMGSKTYASTVESLNQDLAVELTETDLDLESKFSSVNCDTRVTAAVASVKQALARQAAFERVIQEAINQEDFSEIKRKLNEQDAVAFSSPDAKLSFQVSQFSALAKNPRLSNFLSNISKKIGEGTELDAFESKTIKLCLEQSRVTKTRNTGVQGIKESRDYVVFLDKFDLF